MKNTNKLMMYLSIALLVTLLVGSLFHSFIMLPFTYSMILCFSGFYTLAYNGSHTVRLAGTSVMLSFFLSLPFIYSDNTFPFIYWLTLLPFVFYVAHCFHATLHEKSTFDIHYTDLFYTGWNTIIVLGLATVFALFVNGLMHLLTAMLETGGIQTSGISNNVYYLTFSYVGLLIIGIGIIKQHLAIVYKTRFLALQLAWFIYPFIIFLTVIALIVYALKSSTAPAMYTLNNNNQENLIPFLITFFVLGILFFNAVFQEGKKLPSYPFWLHRIVRIYPIFLAVLGVILFCHAMEYVYTIRNIWLLATLVLLYGTGYGVSVFLNEEKAICFIKCTNVVLAIYFAIVAVIANSAVYTWITPPKEPSGEKIIYYGQSFDEDLNWQATDEQKAKLREIFRNQKKASGLSWQSFYPDRDQLPTTADICQIPYKDGFEPGSIIQNQCVITYGGKIFSVEHFLFLDTTHHPVSWQPWPSEHALPLGIEFVPDKMFSDNPDLYLRVLYACKVMLNQHDYIGKVVDSYCNIAYQGKEKSVENFQVLTLKRNE